MNKRFKMVNQRINDLNKRIQETKKDEYLSDQMRNTFVEAYTNLLQIAKDEKAKIAREIGK